ncbi:MAG: glycine cleavage T C-terminal barrel domain-containing protein [Bryobacteraceae bacterium]
MSRASGATDPGYRALRQGAAWLDLSARGRIRASGEDRVRLLHAMSANHIEQLQPGQGCYAFFLNPQGRILADAVILALPEALLIDTEPETRQSLREHLDKHIIADDVELEDVTGSTVEIGIEGPRAPAVAEALGAPLPGSPHAHADWAGRIVVRFTTTGQDGFAIIAPSEEKERLVRDIEAAGATPASDEAARIVRIENARPRYSEDITARYLPHETQLLEAVHFNKGCYLGQEIVERVRSRGGVHRFLVQLEIEGQRVPPAGTKVTAGDREVGELTSAVFSPDRGQVVALGYLRLNELPPEAELRAGDQPARIAARRPLAPG